MEKFSIKIKKSLNVFFNLFSQPGFSFIFALIGYLFFSALNGNPFTISSYPYYNYLADAFLHHQLNLRIIPLDVLDLSPFLGNYYIYWGLLPAIILMPFVAIFGIGVSDILLNIVAGAVSVGLAALLLQQANRRKLIQLTSIKRGILVFFLAFGTVLITMAPLGGIWYTAQLIAFVFLMLAYIAAISKDGWKAFFLTGLALAAVCLTRNITVLAGFFPVYYLFKSHLHIKKKKLALYSLICIFPIFLSVIFLGYYNWIRFGNPLESGLAYHLMSQTLSDDFQNYGLFNTHYVAKNFYYQYLAIPFRPREDLFFGSSLFLLSPLWIATFWSIPKKIYRIDVFGLFGSVLPVAIITLFFLGTGWIQFGPRFSLDFTVPLLLLTAIGIEKWKPKIALIVALISVVQNIAGIIILAIVF